MTLRMTQDVAITRPVLFDFFLFKICNVWNMQNRKICTSKNLVKLVITKFFCLQSFDIFCDGHENEHDDFDRMESFPMHAVIFQLILV